jgi:uncharacterized protein
MSSKINKRVRNNDFGGGWGYEDAFQFSGSPMSGVFGGPGVGPGGPSNTSTLSQPWELAYNESYYFISMNRVLCTYAYTTHGVLRTLVDQPVYDAFRGGLIFKSDELDEEDIKKLDRYMKENKILKKIIDALRWDRLYGGSGLIINTNDNYSTKFNPDKINPDSRFSLIPADRWELSLQGLPFEQDGNPENVVPYKFDYYGRQVDSSRVLRVVGEEAPALARRRLQGWGMSVIECVLREINMYLKHQNATFDLIDQVKIDVYKLKDFNSKVLSKWAQGKVVRRVTLMNQMKNFANALMLDSEDEYQQKQITLSGLAETLVQIKGGMAAACRLPMNKLFGLSSTGFSSGEDDIENYNTICEHERERAGYVIDKVLPLVCRHLFGYEPKITYEWKPLRVLSAVDEQNVLNAKFNRHSGLWAQGFYTSEEYARALKEDHIVLMDTEVSRGTREIEPPANPNATWDTPQQIQTTRKVTEEPK